MTPELQGKLTEILDYLLQTTKQGVEFAGKQLPLVAWEQVAYARAWYTVSCVFLTFALSFAIWRIKKNLAVGQKSGFDDEGLVTVFYSIFCIAVFVASVQQFNTMLKVWFAPRVYLLEWAASLVAQVTK